MPLSLVKTDITIKSEACNAAVDGTLQSYKLNHSHLMRQENLTVSGRPALRLEFSYPQVELMVTLVRSKPAETITLVSYYNKSNSAVVNIMRQLHRSLQVI